MARHGGSARGGAGNKTGGCGDYFVYADDDLRIFANDIYDGPCPGTDAADGTYDYFCFGSVVSGGDDHSADDGIRFTEKGQSEEISAV